MRKATVTRGIIKKEFTIHFLKGIFSTLGALVFWAAFLAGFILLINQLSSTTILQILENLFLISFCLLYIVIYMFIIKDSIRDFIVVSRGKYSVVKDKMVGYKDRVEHHNRANVHKNRPHSLEFEKYGTFYITYNNHYKWTQVYTMTAEELYNKCEIGDTFYLVVSDKNRILHVYSTQFFEFQE